VERNVIKGEWDRIKSKVKERWGQLTHADLDDLEGRREDLIGRIQQRYGIEKEKAAAQVREFESSLD
jgi:uncharacterized protein YjbJ (UPF0337 family)